MDNALRCPQPHSFSRRIVQLIELKDREERRRLSWIVAYRERPDAGACVVVSAFRGRHCASGCVDTKPKVKLGYAH